MNFHYKLNRLIQKCLASAGCHLNCQAQEKPPHPDLDEDEISRLEMVKPYTMTSIERRYHLFQAVRHISKHQIPGAIVECGVWRGGSMMLVAQTLISNNDQTRELYLYDTYEGMPPPSEIDRDFENCSAEIRLKKEQDLKTNSNVWAVASLDEVAKNMGKTGYPSAKIHYIAGKVESTIPEIMPTQIAILRLDTDWYESTAHELKYLYPLVVSGGIVIIDDYGYWKGARKAVDEFMNFSNDRILLNRIDNTGRAFVKP